MNFLKSTLKWTGLFVLVCVLYVVIAIIQGTVTDFQPEEKIVLKPNTNAALQVLDKEEISVLNWNIGYAGLGKESNFFYDAGGFFVSSGKMVYPSRELVDKNLKGIEAFLKANPVDFSLLQEVDAGSKRSYYINELDLLQKNVYPDYASTLAINFDVSRVPLPLAQPWGVMGRMYSGVATYLKYQPTESIRYQFPGEFAWPMRIFNLDRCMAVHRIKTNHPDGRELIIINSHNSAYDSDGSLRKVEQQYLKDFVTKEYEKGNYVIVGADWNQCPPNFTYNQFRPEVKDSSDYPGNIPADFMPAGWTWAVDASTPTNRKLENVYDGQKTFVTLIDYYLLSPNVELLEVKTKDMGFDFSDHQPNLLRVRLKDLLPKPAVIDSIGAVRKDTSVFILEDKKKF